MDGITRLGSESPSPWEAKFGYSRVVAAGPFVLIGGTTAVDCDGVVIGDTPYDQAVVVLAKLTAELARLGLEAEAALQLRAYVTDILSADEVLRAFAETFGEVKPLLTMVEVSALIDTMMYVEIELVAYRG